MKKIKEKNEYIKKLADAKARKNLAPEGKATAELDASKDPMGFIRRNKNMSLKGKKGIAF